MNNLNRIIYANPDINNARSTRLSALERYWNEKRGDNAMPMRAQIDPIEISRLLPIVLLTEIEDKNPIVRLLGSETTAIYGSEMRGRSIKELSFGAFTPAWLKSVASVLDGAAGAAASGLYSVGTHIYWADTVLLPLADSRKRLRYIFGGLIIKPANRDSSLQGQPPKSFLIDPRREMEMDLPVGRNCARAGSIDVGPK